MKIKNALITKANALIEASYKLSVNEQKLILMLTSSVKKEDQEFFPYTIRAQDLASVLGLNNKNIYADIEKLVTGLQKKTLTIQRTVPRKGKKGQQKSTLNINWLSSSEYFHGEGKLELCFDPKLKPYLLNLKQCFTSYKFQEIAQLKSQFAIRIYELLKQYQNFDTRVFSIENLKTILEIEPHQYNPYFNFKKKVILKAQKELQNKTSLTFDFEEIKKGRKVVKIRFIIKKQAIREQLCFPAIRDIEGNNDSTDIEKLILLLPTKYQSHLSIIKILKEALEQYDFDYVTRNIKYTNAKSYANNTDKSIGRHSNYRGYLAKTLKNDFGLAYQEDLTIKKEKEHALQEQARIRKELEEKKKKALAAEEMAAKIEEGQKEVTKQHIALLSSIKLKELEIEATNALNDDLKKIVINKKTGWQRILKVKMNEVLRKRLFAD